MNFEKNIYPFFNYTTNAADTFSPNLRSNLYSRKKLLENFQYYKLHPIFSMQVSKNFKITAGNYCSVNFQFRDFNEAQKT
jgi:hypothetical protein